MVYRDVSIGQGCGCGLAGSSASASHGLLSSEGLMRMDPRPSSLM